MKNKLYSIALWILFLLFCFRVFAQLLQYFLPNSFLPPFEAWHSGTLSYAALVFFQFVIIGIYLSVCVRISIGKLNPHKSIGKRLLVLGGIYAFIMITRYILRMSMFPSERWFGGSIPILFHVVLASFLITLGIYHVRNGAIKSVAPGLSKKILWTSVYAILVALTFVWLLYQLMPALIAKNTGLRPSIYSVSIEKSVPMTMSDGAVLRADIYRPEKLSTAPTILIRIPLDDNFKGKLMSNVLGRMWSERGYNVVVQGVRGRFNSTGKHIPFEYEREDGISTLQWLNRQPWHNGKTGMWGGSYFGYTQWVLADQDSLGLSALITQISSSSNYKMFYPGGAFAYESALFWATRSYSQKDTPLDYEALRKGFDGAPLIEADDRVVGDIPFYNDWVSHDRLDKFWTAVDGVDRAKHLKVPALTMAGWYDPFLSSQIQDFEDISQYADKAVSQKCKLIIGPWAHAETVAMPDGYQDRNYRLSSIAPAISWYDEHLRNVKTEASPRVRIFVMGINQWRDEVSFPLERTLYTPYYLAADLAKPGESLLTPTPPSYDSSRQAYAFDPAHPVQSIGGSVLGARAGAKKQNEIEGRNDVLVYTSGVLEQNVEVTGKIKLILHVSTDAKSTDFMARLCDVHPDGRSFNISEGAIRQAYKNKDTEEIEIELNPSSNVFLSGHRIRLLVASSSYPRFSVNYNTGNEIYNEQKGVVANQNVYTGSMFLSRLILPIVPTVRQ